MIRNISVFGVTIFYDNSPPRLSCLNCWNVKISSYTSPTFGIYWFSSYLLSLPLTSNPQLYTLVFSEPLCIVVLYFQDIHFGSHFKLPIMFQLKNSGSLITKSTMEIHKGFTPLLLFLWVFTSTEICPSSRKTIIESIFTPRAYFLYTEFPLDGRYCRSYIRCSRFLLCAEVLQISRVVKPKYFVLPSDIVQRKPFLYQCWI